VDDAEHVEQPAAHLRLRDERRVEALAAAHHEVARGDLAAARRVRVGLLEQPRDEVGDRVRRGGLAPGGARLPQRRREPGDEREDRDRPEAHRDAVAPNELAGAVA
jgi:hypothetical protein